MAGPWILLAVQHCFLGLGLCMRSLGQQGDCWLSWEYQVWEIVHLIIRAFEVGAAQWWPSETMKVPSPVYDWVLVVWGQGASKPEV